MQWVYCGFLQEYEWWLVYKSHCIALRKCPTSPTNRMLTPTTGCFSCSGHHSCYNLEHSIAMPWPEICIPHHCLPFWWPLHSFYLSSIVFPKPWRGWCGWSICDRLSNSQVFLSTLSVMWNLCSYCYKMKTSLTEVDSSTNLWVQTRLFEVKLISISYPFGKRS